MTEDIKDAANLPYREDLLDLSALTPKIQWAYRYWKNKITSGGLPSRQDLSPVEMISILPNIILLDVQWDPLDFRYRLIGTDIDRHSEQNHTGKWMSEIPERRAPSTVWDNCAMVATNIQPSCRSIPYVGRHRDFATTSQITLPLSSNGKQVDMLFIVIEYVGSGGVDFTQPHAFTEQPPPGD